MRDCGEVRDAISFKVRVNLYSTQPKHSGKLFSRFVFSAEGHFSLVGGVIFLHKSIPICNCFEIFERLRYTQ